MHLAAKSEMTGIIGSMNLPYGFLYPQITAQYTTAKPMSTMSTAFLFTSAYTIPQHETMKSGAPSVGRKLFLR